MAKKIKFLVECDSKKFSAWPVKKNVISLSVNQHSRRVSTKKLKRKLKANARKDRRKEREIRERANRALQTNLVVNLSDVEVPLYSIAVLSYGPGWIPCPTFDEMQFRMDGYYGAN